MTQEAFDAFLNLIATMVDAQVNDPNGEGHYRQQIKTATDAARALLVKEQPNEH